MSLSIIGLQDGPQGPWEAYLLAWEREQLRLCVSDIFGYHALQLGLPQLDALQANRMPHRWLADQQIPLAPIERSPVVLTDFAALPFASSSIDLVVLPHTLEFSANPHATLREVERILVPEGRVVVCGRNPVSLWGWQQRRRRPLLRANHTEAASPELGAAIAYGRLRDWLQLLSFEVESVEFGCYRPYTPSATWLQRFAWMDTWGPQWGRIFGGAYFVVAVKRVRGMRLLPVPRKAQVARRAAPISVANRTMDFETPEKND